MNFSVLCLICLVGCASSSSASLLNSTDLNDAYLENDQGSSFLQLIVSNFKKLLELTPEGSIFFNDPPYQQFDPSQLENLITNESVVEVDEYLRSCHEFDKSEADVLSAFRTAINSGKIEIFKYLIAQGFPVDVDVQDKRHGLYIQVLGMERGPLRDQFLLLIYDHSQKLFEMVFEPRLKETATSAEPTVFTNWQTAVTLALRHDDFLFIKWLLEERGARADCDFGAQGSFIHAAVLFRADSCLKTLLEHGADPNVPFPRSVVFELRNSHSGKADIRGYTPLMLATWMYSLECANVLLEDPRIEVTKGLPQNPFMMPRDLARKIQDPGKRSEFLRILKARPADSVRLAKWIDAVELRSLSMDLALAWRNRGMVEFLLHNVVDLEIKEEWLRNLEFKEILSIEAAAAAAITSV